MKLTHLHIENYGKFSDYDYDFKDGLNEFCEENGFGKTTLASFIKAMFYGLPSYRTNSKEFNDRAHFLPFKGGNFGGNLSFITDGKEYRIERFFDKKSDSGDTLKVFYNGAPYTGFGNDIGLSVFKIDKDSFERTAFIDSSDIDFGATGSISAKLNNCVDGLSGTTFEAAVDRLDKAKKILKPMRSTNGKINEAKQKISRLNDEISNLNTKSQSLQAMYVQLNLMDKDISSLEKQKEQALTANNVQEQWNTYDGYITEAEVRKNKLNALNGTYPAGIPAKEEGAQLKKLSGRLAIIESSGKAAVFGGDKKAELDALAERFACGVPTDDELEEISVKNNQLIAAQNEADRLENQDGGEEFAALERKFAGGAPSEKVIAECDGKINEMRLIDDKLSARAEEPAPRKSKGKGGFSAGCAAGVLCVILGIVLGVFINIIAGAAISAAGLAAALVFAVLYVKSRGKQPALTNTGSTQLQEQKLITEREIYSVIAAYGYYTQSGVQYDYYAFKNDVKRYAELKQCIAANREALKQKRAEADKLYGEIARFFARYGITGGSFAKNNGSLIEYKKDYGNLVAEKSATEQKQRQARQDYAENYRAFNDILAKYKLVCSGDMAEFAEQICLDAAEKARLEQEFSDWNKKAEDYKTKNNLTTRPLPQAVDIKELNAALNDYHRRYAALNGEISDCEAEVEALDGLRNNLEEEQERLDSYQKRYQLLERTITLLKEADKSLKDKYVAPVKDRFLHYSDMIESALGEKVIMDGNYNIYFERGGEQRSDKHLSAGQRSVCALCFRLALIDRMYVEEQPFVVMDDPFINIDDEHIQKTASLVKQLSRDRQIIYFCCHTSRRLG